VRIYSFEATGNGTYDLEAGLEYNKDGGAITTALGCNQLLATNSVEILTVGEALRGNCSFYGGWLHQPQMRFGHDFRPMPRVDCSYKNHYRNSKSIPTRSGAMCRWVRGSFAKMTWRPYSACTAASMLEA
jgi:hypothetical protein